VARFGQREHLKAIGVYDPVGVPLAVTPGYNSQLGLRPAAATRAGSADKGQAEYTRFDGSSMHIYAIPLHHSGIIAGTLVLLHDASYIDTQIGHNLRDSLLTALLQTALISGLALLLVRLNFIAPLAKTSKWLVSLRQGVSHSPPSLPQGEIFQQLHTEVTHLAKDLNHARAIAEQEAKLRESNVALWTAERLRVNLRDKLHNNPVFVVSNREPYLHVYNDKHQIEVVVPASGLVTALEPILLACHGTWVAHGSGSADRDTVDNNDRLRVPPNRPSYNLRRVWLTAEEERGYYQGFSNEGLWALCHIAHTRPVFRPEDWKFYQHANRKFADTLLQEMEGAEAPIVLAQDFHFALLPRMIKEARPDARVAIFWHIPWPNAESFSICPWQRELVDGLLGADLIGFQIQSHCNNFLETVDRAVEALTEWDRFAVNRQGHVTRVRPYPISVAFPESQTLEIELRSPGEARAQLFAELGVEASLLGVGVDRIDYTKGILERLRGVERFLELHPEYQGRFTYVQLGAPSRTDLLRYRQLVDEVTTEVERLNAKFARGKWQPVVFLKRHHSHEEIDRFYKLASVCLVTSLHDGMNLVAKEFIASRDDQRGSLILSTFAGAANQLPDALLVNPYDEEQVAAAILRALEMPEEEQETRMRRMRRHVREHNIYRWAANLLSDLTEIRIDTPDRVEVP
jgi:trehalose 6-phosphate synthase